MSPTNILQLASAVIGFAGTAMLFAFTHAERPYEGATWANDQTNARNDEIRRKNARDLRLQKLGFGLLCMSFGLQLGAIFFAP